MTQSTQPQLGQRTVGFDDYDGSWRGSDRLKSAPVGSDTAPMAPVGSDRSRSAPETDVGGSDISCRLPGIHRHASCGHRFRDLPTAAR